MKRYFYIFMTLGAAACAPPQAGQHPDDFLVQNQGLYTVEDIAVHSQAIETNPTYRQAMVTLESDSNTLPLRSTPEFTASAVGTLPQNTEIQMDWPRVVTNNHLRIYFNNQSYWVPFRRPNHTTNITLLEDLLVPEVQVPSSGFLRVQRQVSAVPQVNDSISPMAVPNSLRPVARLEGLVTSTPESVSLPPSLAELITVQLPQSRITEANSAIRAVALQPASVASCQSQPLIGNNSGSFNCYEQVVVADPFHQFVTNYANSCALQAGQEAFGQRPSQVLFQTSSAGQVFGDRTVGNSSTLSTHATGMAFDLFAMTFIFTGQRQEKIVLHRNQMEGSSPEQRRNHTFYWSFVGCWREAVQANWDCSCGGDNAGAITYQENNAHRNHIHMSMSHCERSTYNVSCI